MAVAFYYVRVNMITACDKAESSLTIHYTKQAPSKQEIFDLVLNKFGNEFDNFRYLVTEEIGNSETGLVLVDIDFGNIEF
jgi:hypothetical protein